MLNKVLIYVIILINLLHCSLSLYDISSYSITRIILSILFSSLIIYIIFFKKINFVFILKDYFLFYTFTIYLFIQSFYSNYINTNFEFYQQLFITINIFLYFTSLFILINNKHLINFKIKSFLLIIIYSLITIYLFIFINSLYSNIGLVQSIENIFSNRRFFNHIQTLFIPIIFYTFLISKNKFLKLGLSLFIILNFYFVFLTGARGTLYSLLIASTIIFFTSNKRIKFYLLYFYSLVVISYITYTIAMFINNDMLEHSSHFKTISSTGREFIFTTILDHLFDLKYFFSAIGFSTQDIAVVGFLHPHNIFLYIFLGAGTLGLLVFIYLVFRILSKILKVYFLKQNSLYYKMFTFSFISIFVHSLISGIYITPLVSAYLFVFFLIYFKKYSSHRNLNNCTLSYINIIIMFILVIMAILNIYLLKINLDSLLMYSNISYEHNVPGIFLFNDNIYK